MEKRVGQRVKYKISFIPSQLHILCVTGPRFLLSITSPMCLLILGVVERWRNRINTRRTNG